MSKHCPKLTDHQYAKSFHALKLASREHQVANQWFSRYLAPWLLDRTPSQLISVGSGSGEFDSLLISSLLNTGSKAQKGTLKIHLSCLEPSKSMKDDLFFNLNKLRSSSFDFSFFDQSFETYIENKPKNKFDLIIFAHSLYYIQDRAKSLQHAMNLLQDKGLVLIVHQGPVGIAQIQNKFLEKISGCTEYKLSSAELLRSMENLKLPMHYELLPTALDVTPCFEKNDDIGLSLLNFFLECDTSTLSTGLREEILQFIWDITFSSGRRRLLMHPVATILLAKDGGIFEKLDLSADWRTIHSPFGL